MCILWVKAHIHRLTLFKPACIFGREAELDGPFFPNLQNQVSDAFGAMVFNAP